MPRALAVPVAAAALLPAPAVASASVVEALPPANPPRVEEVAPGVRYERIARADGQVIHVIRAPASPRVSSDPPASTGTSSPRAPTTRAASS